jgi:uncharacterized membrane protein SpoIIM required for sporulation
VPKNPRFPAYRRLPIRPRNEVAVAFSRHNDWRCFAVASLAALLAVMTIIIALITLMILGAAATF